MRGRESRGNCPRRVIPSKRAANRGRAWASRRLGEALWRRTCTRAFRIVWCHGHFCVSPSVDHIGISFSDDWSIGKGGSFDEQARPCFFCRSRKFVLFISVGHELLGGRENKITVLTHTDGHFLLAS
jgi:hypothetical protein